MSSLEELTALGVEVCWRQWTRLGVSGVKGQESHCVVDPEALIVFTATLEDADPRLRDESTDWCARYGPQFVSTSRLRNLAALEPDKEPVQEYFATVNANSKSRWPAADAVPRPVEISGKSRLPRLKKDPALLRLQLRAMFGVTARAEILMVFLTSRPSPEPFLSASDLEITGYSKRNIAFVLEELGLCELLTARRFGNMIRYRLNERAHLTKLAPAASGALFSRWDLQFHLLAEVLRLARRYQGQSSRIRSVEARKFVLDQAWALDQLDLVAPAVESTDAYWEEVLEWAATAFIPGNLRT